MPLKIMHIGDVHIGMKFSKYHNDNNAVARLIEARFETLERLVKRANQERCHLLVVAGDLFHDLRVKKGDIERAAAIINQFEAGTALVLPGNHDHYLEDSDDVWLKFESHASDNVEVLKRVQIRVLEEDDFSAAIYACPCHSKHSPDDPTAWIAESERPDSVDLHICIAHGSLAGLSPDIQGVHFPMDETVLNRLQLDAVLLGHTHKQYPASPGATSRVFNPGTPEPDGLDCSHGGMAWLLELEPKMPVKATSLHDVGTCRFVRKQVAVESDTDVEALKQALLDAPSDRTLLDLQVTGRLPESALKMLGQLKQAIEDAYLWCVVDISAVRLHIDTDVIRREFAENSFPYQLLIQLSQDAADGEALQVAWDLVQEARQ